jgi:hydrogenase maturation protease
MTTLAGDELVLVIGVGNEYRSDDGLGIYAARELRHRLPEDVSVREESGEGTSLIQGWEGFSHVVIVDAVSSGAQSGVLHQYNAIAEKVPKRWFNSSSHQFGVAEAIAMARYLNRLPRTLVLYGIEGETFEPGIGLSESVVKSVPDLLHRIERDIQRLLSQSLTEAGKAIRQQQM